MAATGKEQDDGTVVNATIQAILEVSAKGEDHRWIMPEKHDVNESVTTIEQCTAFGNLNIGVSFALRRKSGNPESSCPSQSLGQRPKRGRTHLTGNGICGIRCQHCSSSTRGEELAASSLPTLTSPTSPGSNSTHTFAQRRDVSIRQSYLEQPR